MYPLRASPFLQLRPSDFAIVFSSRPVALYMRRSFILGGKCKFLKRKMWIGDLNFLHACPHVLLLLLRIALKPRQGFGWTQAWGAFFRTLNTLTCLVRYFVSFAAWLIVFWG